MSGSNLIVTLTNTSATDVNADGQLLTAVFFDVSGATLSTTGASATVSAGSIVQPTLATTTNVGGEWAYEFGLSGAPNGATSGLSSAGFNLFGQPNLNSPNIARPVNQNGSTPLDGGQFGIVSAGYTTANDVNGFANGGSYIKNAVVFTLSGLPNGFSLSQISNVSFQYGTALMVLTSSGPRCRPRCSCSAPPSLA